MTKLVIHNHLPKRRRVRDTGMSTGKPRKDLPEDFSDFEHGTFRKQPSTKPSRYSEREDPSEMERPVIRKDSDDAGSLAPDLWSTDVTEIMRWLNKLGPGQGDVINNIGVSHTHHDTYPGAKTWHIEGRKSPLDITNVARILAAKGR